MIILYCQII
jgi:acyloxyacyl hydrolase